MWQAWDGPKDKSERLRAPPRGGFTLPETDSNLGRVQKQDPSWLLSPTVGSSPEGQAGLADDAAARPRGADAGTLWLFVHTHVHTEGPSSPDGHARLDRGGRTRCVQRTTESH